MISVRPLLFSEPKPLEHDFLNSPKLPLREFPKRTNQFGMRNRHDALCIKAAWPQKTDFHDNLETGFTKTSSIAGL
jgi:hypothetical protein